jgi:hypothetical protein
MKLAYVLIGFGILYGVDILLKIVLSQEIQGVTLAISAVCLVMGIMRYRKYKGGK